MWMPAVPLYCIALHWNQMSSVARKHFGFFFSACALVHICMFNEIAILHSFSLAKVKAHTVCGAHKVRYFVYYYFYGRRRWRQATQTNSAPKCFAIHAILCLTLFCAALNHEFSMVAAVFIRKPKYKCMHFIFTLYAGNKHPHRL